MSRTDPDPLAARIELHALEQIDVHVAQAAAPRLPRQ
jgi:hypothetical protein